MDKVVSDIIKKCKSIGDVDRIVKIGDKYVITLSKNGKPLLDCFYSYKDGKLELYSPYKEFDKVMKAAEDPIYIRR